MKKPLDDVFRDNDLSWNMVSVIFGVRSSSHAETNTWFRRAGESLWTTHHCSAPCSAQEYVSNKTSPPKLIEGLKIVVECVNCGQKRAIKHCIFKELSNEMGSEFEVLLHHSAESYFGHASGISPFFAKAHCHADCFKNSEFILILAYMTDIFDALDRQTRGQ